MNEPPDKPERKRTTVALDRVAAAAAQAELGTTTLTATINAALREIGARGARRRFVERLTSQDGIELADPDVTRSAWS